MPSNRSHQNQQRMIRLFLQSKGIIPAAQPKKSKPTPPTEPPKLPSIPPMVDPIILESYVNGHHRGPTAEDMQVAWSQSLQHPWNKAIINLLSSEFGQNVKACRYQLLPELPNDAGKAYVKDAITNKLSARQTWVRDKMQKMRDRGHLTASELSEFFTEVKRGEAAKARRRERKKYVSHSTHLHEISNDHDSALSQACRNHRRCIEYPVVERS